MLRHALGCRLLVVALCCVFAVACNRPGTAASNTTEWLWYQPNGCKPGVAVLLSVRADAIESATFSLIDPEPSTDDPLKSIGHSQDVKLLKRDGMSFHGEFTEPGTGQTTGISLLNWKAVSDREAQATMAVGSSAEKSDKGKMTAIFVQRVGASQ